MSCVEFEELQTKYAVATSHYVAQDHRVRAASAQDPQVWKKESLELEIRLQEMNEAMRVFVRHKEEHGCSN